MANQHEILMKMEMYQDDMTVLSKVLHAIQKIKPENDQQKEFLYNLVEQFRSDLHDSREMYEDFRDLCD